MPENINERISRLRERLKSTGRKTALGAAMIQTLAPNVNASEYVMSQSQRNDFSPTPIEISTEALKSSEIVSSLSGRTSAQTFRYADSDKEILDAVIAGYNNQKANNTHGPYTGEFVVNLLTRSLGNAENKDSSLLIKSLNLSSEDASLLLENSTIMSGIDDSSKDELIKKSLNMSDYSSEQRQQALLDLTHNEKIFGNLGGDKSDMLKKSLAASVQNEVKNNNLSAEFAAYAYEENQWLGDMTAETDRASTQSKLLQTMYDDKDFWNKLDKSQKSLLMQDAFNSPEVMDNLGQEMRQDIVGNKLKTLLDEKLYQSESNTYNTAMSELSQTTKYADKYDMSESMAQINEFGTDALKKIEREKYDKSNLNNIESQTQTAYRIAYAVDDAMGKGYTLKKLDETVAKEKNNNAYAYNFVGWYGQVAQNNPQNNDLLPYQKNNHLMPQSLLAPREEDKGRNVQYLQDGKIETVDQYIAFRRFYENNPDYSDKEAVSKMKEAIGVYEKENPMAGDLFEYSKAAYFDNLKDDKAKEGIKTLQNDITNSMNSNNYNSRGVSSDKHKIKEGGTIDKLFEDRENKTKEISEKLNWEHGIDCLPAIGVAVQNGKVRDKGIEQTQGVYFVGGVIYNNALLNKDTAAAKMNSEGVVKITCGLVDDKGIPCEGLRLANGKNNKLTVDIYMEGNGVRLVNNNAAGALQRGKINAMTTKNVQHYIGKYGAKINEEKDEYKENAKSLVGQNNQSYYLAKSSPSWTNSGNGNHKALYSYERKVQNDNSSTKNSVQKLAFYNVNMSRNGGR